MRIISLFGIFVISFILFLICEVKAESPILPLTLFKNKEFTGSAIAIILSNLFLVAVTVIMPTYFTHLQNKSELEAALLITPISLMIFIWSPLSAVVLDKLGPRFIIAAGFILMTIAYYLFIHLDMNNIANVVISCIILGTGYGIIAGPITVLAASNFKGYLLTASQSSIGVLREVGVSLAVAIFLTGLYSNLSTAKTNSVNYAEAQVSQLNVPAKQKQTIKQKATAAVENKNGLHNKNDQISKHQIDTIITQEYQKILKKLPANTSKQEKEKVFTKVSSIVNMRFKEIGKATNNIKKYAQKQYSDAFFNLYKISLPFLLISSLSFLLFPSKKKSSSSVSTNERDK